MFALRSIKLYNFMAHAQRELVVPPRGIVLITGRNGAGKSSFIEAVAVAMWGATRRGTPPWRTNVPGSVEVVTDTLHVRRGVDKAHKATLMWNDAGKPLTRTGKDSKGDTTAKAQAALDRVVPDMDIWAWANVLSNIDTATLSGATDATRKAMLEHLMGLLSTEDWLKLLRTELAAARTALATEEGKRAVVAAQIAGAERRKKDSGLDTPPPDLAALTERGRVAKAQLDAAAAHITEAQAAVTAQEATTRAVQAEVDAAISAMTAASSAAVAVQTNIEELQAQAADVAASVRALEAQHKACSVSDCPTCGQAIDPAYAVKLRQALEATREQHRFTSSVLEAERKRVAAERARLAEERKQRASEQDKLRVRVHNSRADEATLRAAVQMAVSDHHRALVAYETCKRDYIAAQTDLQHRAKAETTRREAESELLRLQGEAVELEVRVTDIKTGIARDEVLENLLGVKGIPRLKVLSTTLDAITDVANLYLSKIAGPKFRLKLKPYSDKGSRNSISLEVSGAGGGHGYKASSGGERKRIDLALMLALGDIARAAHGGGKTSTLFYDEAFDSLDIEGREACVRLLKELSQDRAVVVVSHDVLLIKALERDAVRVHIE